MDQLRDMHAYLKLIDAAKNDGADTMVTLLTHVGWNKPDGLLSIHKQTNPTGRNAFSEIGFPELGPTGVPIYEVIARATTWSTEHGFSRLSDELTGFLAETWPGRPNTVESGFDPAALDVEGVQLRYRGPTPDAYKVPLGELRAWATGNTAALAVVSALTHHGWARGGEVPCRATNSIASNSSARAVAAGDLPAECYAPGEPTGPQLAASMAALEALGAPSGPLKELWDCYCGGVVSDISPATSRSTPGSLTKAEAVLEAVEEFRSLGRNTFLDKYGFAVSRVYFMSLDDQLFDTKPIVAAALAIERPDLPPLKAGDFSGGLSGAVRVLEKLGFEVVTTAQISPPELGDTFANRTEIAEHFGGDKVGGVITFPGEQVVNVFSDAESPYADDPPSLTEPFGYRGAGLSGPQKLATRGNAALEGVRTRREAARFWYRAPGGVFTCQSWVTVLGRAWVSGKGQDSFPRPEIQWMLQVVPGTDSATWPPHITEPQAEAAATTEESSDPPEAKSAPTYEELVDRVDAAGQSKGPSGVVKTNYPRSVAARRAVLVRCGGKCESPWCTGAPGELNRQGEPILDVDHIKDLAAGGEDLPRNMVALCPNCHAVKTRGTNAVGRRKQLLAVAAAAHQAALSASFDVSIS
ncbi:hypothetical protein J2X11_001696 [Aeromicrobium panaciterrae]|uniref:HNH nuclease domain-containing protein n=1 Tax=Aeromicrobium panaciterrae TaxID=363861 RepID=A0ABU1UNV8_9ACTN|nr:HNH endonuclease signature motif containing protein [Aeromicrobium panaciterrae]MDR7086857.1 hypothetical protein [Aeromicrobium panaciterrae]